MTIYKSQGQTLKNVGIYLVRSVFFFYMDNCMKQYQAYNSQTIEDSYICNEDEDNSNIIYFLSNTIFQYFLPFHFFIS